jgi:hypothetical protein
MTQFLRLSWLQKGWGKPTITTADFFRKIRSVQEFDATWTLIDELVAQGRLVPTRTLNGHVCEWRIIKETTR